MEFYTRTDLCSAQRRLRRCALVLGGWLLLMLALYAWAVLRGARGAMLALMLVAFAGSVFAGDLWLLPALRYVKFLRTLEAGLRRSTRCAVEAVGSAVEQQDGAQVRALEVRLRPGGDTRIFYVNASKEALFPQPGAEIVLTSCGRHAVGWEAAEETKENGV